MTKALDIQVGGSHYKSLKIQPVEYIHANGIGYFEGNVIKYVTRWRDKNGIPDLEKAKHYIDLLIEQEKMNASKNCSGQSESIGQTDNDIRVGVPQVHPCRTDDSPNVLKEWTKQQSSSNQKVHGSISGITDHVGKEQGWYEQQRVFIPFTGGHVSFPLEGQRIRGSSIDFPADKDRAAQAMVKQTFGVATEYQSCRNSDGVEQLLQPSPGQQNSTA